MSRDRVIETDSRRMFEGVARGDESAARDLFAAYVQQLVTLARRRLSDRLRQKLDADDIVQSAFRSFFVRARDGQFVIERSGQLWALLAAMTRHKLLSKVEHYRQQKRDLNRDVGDLSVYVSTSEPTVEEALALADELELVLRDLAPLNRKIAELRLQGQSIPEIADAVERSERTVRRLLSDFRNRLEQRLRDAEGMTETE